MDSGAPILWILRYTGVGRFKINGLFFLKVRGFFDNDRRNLHYQTKPGKQLLHCPYTSYRNVNFVVVYFSEQPVITCAANESKHDVRLDPFSDGGTATVGL